MASPVKESSPEVFWHNFQKLQEVPSDYKLYIDPKGLLQVDEQTWAGRAISSYASSSTYGGEDTCKVIEATLKIAYDILTSVDDILTSLDEAKQVESVKVQDNVHKVFLGILKLRATYADTASLGTDDPKVQKFDQLLHRQTLVFRSLAKHKLPTEKAYVTDPSKALRAWNTYTLEAKEEREAPAKAKEQEEARLLLVRQQEEAQLLRVKEQEEHHEKQTSAQVLTAHCASKLAQASLAVEKQKLVKTARELKSVPPVSKEESRIAKALASTVLDEAISKAMKNLSGGYSPATEEHDIVNTFTYDSNPSSPGCLSCFPIPVSWETLTSTNADEFSTLVGSGARRITIGTPQHLQMYSPVITARASSGPFRSQSNTRPTFSQLLNRTFRITKPTDITKLH
jgi:phage antirepressor YoqD-like protein